MIRKMKREDAQCVIDMMRVFYASDAVSTNGSDEIFTNDFENCVNDCPYLEGYVFEKGGEVVGYGMLANGEWPTYDEAKCVDNEIEIVVQINGKIRAKMMIATDIEAADAIALAKADEKIAALLDGKTIVKEIYVPGKILNIVAK